MTAYRLIGKSRDGSDTSELTVGSLIEANAAYNHLLRDGYFIVVIIGPDGRELSEQEFTECVMDEEKLRAERPRSKDSCS